MKKNHKSFIVVGSGAVLAAVVFAALWFTHWAQPVVLGYQAAYNPTHTAETSYLSSKETFSEYADSFPAVYERGITSEDVDALSIKDSEAFNGAARIYTENEKALRNNEFYEYIYKTSEGTK